MSSKARYSTPMGKSMPRNRAELDGSNNGCNHCDISFIDARLAMGSQPVISHLATFGFTHVVNLRGEHTYDAEAADAGLEVLNINWTDVRTTQSHLEDDLDAIRAFVESSLEQPKSRVLIHCAAGVERTPLAAYVLLRARGMLDSDVRALLRQVRPEIFLSFIDGNSYRVENYLDERGLRQA